MILCPQKVKPCLQGMMFVCDVSCDSLSVDPRELVVNYGGGPLGRMWIRQRPTL